MDITTLIDAWINSPSLYAQIVLAGPLVLGVVAGAWALFTRR